MTHTRRGLAYLFLAALCSANAGCFAWSQNPSYFPYLLPAGDVVRPHSRPISPGANANFDPHAIDLALETTPTPAQVGSQVVVLATVRDEKAVPRRNRMVEWTVNGGNLIQVDESGVFNGRGGMFGNSGWSFTDYHEHRLDRGNNNKADDIMIRPGQTWCVVTSPVEGDTHITAVVPGIYNWDRRMKTVVVRWVDAAWEFPPRAVARFGTEHEFVTRIARFTDRQPLAKYRVRYKILDGPPAVLLPSQAAEQTVITDLDGVGKVRIRQVAPASGVNRVQVEIVRPPDPTTPTGAGITIVTGETSIEWLAPNVKLGHVGPASAAVDQTITFTTAARNEGRIESQSLMISLPIPDGVEFVSSVPPPPGEPRNGVLEYPFGALPPGGVHTVQATYKTRRAGPIKSVALMRTAEGQTDQQEVNTLVTTPQLKAELIAPKTGILDVPIHYAVRLTNPGTGDLDEILMIASYDVGLEHDKVNNPLNDPKNNLLSVKVGGLKAGESRDEILILTPRRAGVLGVRLKATSGGLEAQAQALVNVQKPNVSLRVDGPAKRYVGRPAEWRLVVKNEGEFEQTGVAVRTRLPAELRYVNATRNAVSVGAEVAWNVGALKAGEEIVLDLTTECLKAAPAAEMTTTLTADGGVRVDRANRIEIEGIAALKMEMRNEVNPVEVGKTASYLMTLTNTGSAPARIIDVKATVPDLLKAVRATGPTKETIAGKLVTFDRIDTLQPGAKVVIRIECQALKEGDARFRVEYTSSLNATPIFEEEPTRIVAPFPGGPIPAPEVKKLPPG